MTVKSDLQLVIDTIHQGQLSDGDLASLLHDERALVRANVLMALPQRALRDKQTIVEVVVAAAEDSKRGGTRLLGSVTQRKFAIATLAWLDFDIARAAYQRIAGVLGDEERCEIEEFVKQGPVT